MTFKPGQTGNPGGRTVAQREREKSFAEAIRGLAGDDGLDYVRELDKKPMSVEDVGKHNRLQPSRVHEILATCQEKLRAQGMALEDLMMGER